MRSSIPVRIAGVALSLSTCLTAQAQVEEVVVTAQRREQPINDVPISISAYDGNTLKQLGVTSAEELQKLTPGLE
ncbi:hypothetical protein, partial [Steroidobacter sp.]|uniref:hypothetical protein n=1 Tax=Steroidobacter sp. TaxID=1978227 RepID=UPI001A3F00B8